jgi:hypothetical protein
VPYIKETCYSGKVIEVVKKYSARYHKPGIKRGENRKPTTEEVQSINKRHAETKLRRIINTNFGEGDYHVVLTYKPQDRPDPEGAKECISKFLRKMRTTYKKSCKELKYIVVTEIGKKGAIHHHLVINAGKAKWIKEAWPYGGVYITPLDNTGQYGLLASYLIKQVDKLIREKEYPWGKRWCQSRNLDKPKVVTEIVSANSWRKPPEAKKGYYLEDEKVRSGDCFGYEYLFYSMVALQTVRRRC